MTKNYKKIMPFEDNIKVLTQFGQLPLSVMEFTNEPKWSCAYFEQDKEEQRRSEDSKYLPGLGMSEFSSAVCEFIVRYWSMRNSVVYDPFAGRATRAVISTKLHRKYIGLEISPRTFERSIDHMEKLELFNLGDEAPVLFNKDGCNVDCLLDESAHLCMTCPPYWNLEEYESVDGQLSDCKTYGDFLDQINSAIQHVYRILKPGGFSCWVAGDWRDSGGYRMFTHDVQGLFFSNKFVPHDTVIIRNNSPFAAFQAYKCACKRITSKIHETIVVFRKPGELDTSGLVKDELNEKANEFFT
jgi:DNA modification methylase